MQRCIAPVVLMVTPLVCLLVGCSLSAAPAGSLPASTGAGPESASPTAIPPPSPADSREPLPASTDAGPGSASPTAIPPPSPAESPGPLPTSTSDWGPMAVALPPHNMHEARLEGVLRITARCVYLQAPSGQFRDTLLVWPHERSAWRADIKGVELTSPDGEVVVVDGSRIILGGSGLAQTEPEEWLGTINWLSPPDPSCPLNAYWELNQVTKRSE